MITRRMFFDVLSQRKTSEELSQLVGQSGFLPDYLRVEAFVLYARFLGSQLKLTNGYDVFSTSLGQRIWDGTPMVPGAGLGQSRDDWNRGRADLTWTNLLRSNCFSPPESMLVGGFMVTLDANTPGSELVAFQRNVVGRLELCGRTVKEIPMSLATVVTGGDLTDIVSEVQEESTGRVNIGAPSPFVTSAYVPCDPPINLETLMQFSFTLESPHPWDVPEDLGGYVFFDGVRFRGVH